MSRARVRVERLERRPGAGTARVEVWRQDLDRPDQYHGPDGVTLTRSELEARDSLRILVLYVNRDELPTNARVALPDNGREQL